MPKESTISKNIVKFLNSLPKSNCRKRHAGPMRKGMADITGVLQGHAIEFETKTPDNPHPTPIQRKWLDDCAEAGAITAVVMSVEDAKNALKPYDIEFF